jgi:hypothetical protein
VDCGAIKKYTAEAVVVVELVSDAKQGAAVAKAQAGAESQAKASAMAKLNAMGKNMVCNGPCEKKWISTEWDKIPTTVEVIEVNAWNRFWNWARGNATYRITASARGVMTMRCGDK